MWYSYYDYLENYYEDLYDYYYEYQYWPYYYGNYNGSNTTYNGTYPPSPYEYVHKYNMDIITPPLFTISILCAILSVCITILIFYKMYHSKHVQKKIETDKVTIGLTLFCAVMHLGQNIIDPITYYTWFIEYDPVVNRKLYIAYETFWCLSKLSLYMLFIYRYYVLFTASTMMTGRSKKDKYAIFGCFTIVMVVQCCLYFTYMLLNPNYEFIEFTAEGRIWLRVCWAFLVFDVALIGILGYLLTHSILTLIVDINKFSHKRKPNDSQFCIPSTGHTIQIAKSDNSAQSPDSSTQTKATKIESQLSDYIQDKKKHTPQTEMVETVADHEMILFLNDYGLNTDDIMNKIKEGRIRLHHLIQIDYNGLDKLCKSFELNITRGIKFRSAVRELQQTHAYDEPLSVGSENSMGSHAHTVKYKGKKKKKNVKKSNELNSLMHTTTRIALTMLISMISSFIYQLLWLLAFQLEEYEMLWATYTWCIDGVVNMVCVYLSMGMAKNHYKKICHDICKLHQCTLKCIQKVVPGSKV